MKFPWLLFGVGSSSTAPKPMTLDPKIPLSPVRAAYRELRSYGWAEREIDDFVTGAILAGNLARALEGQRILLSAETPSTAKSPETS